MRKQWFEQLLAITLSQKDYLFNNEYKAFIALLDERQELIDKIRENLKIEPITIEEKALLKQVKELDDNSITEYNRQIAEAKSKLRELNSVNERDKQYIYPYTELGKGLHFDKKEYKG